MEPPNVNDVPGMQNSPKIVRGVILDAQVSYCARGRDA